MRLYISDGERLTKLKLPKEAKESCLLSYSPYNSRREFSINVESENDNWVLKSNGMVNIVENGSVILEQKISNYSTHYLDLLGEKETKYMYALPDIEENLVDVSLYGLNGLLIGSAPNCQICYNNPLVSQQHIIIQKSNDKMLLTANSPEVYINGVATRQAYLKDGDIIFVAGLMIIFMTNFLRLNNPNTNVMINGLQNYNELASTDYTQYDKVNSSELDVDLYDESDYFYHIPRIINGLEEETVEIDAPPSEEKENHTPLILSLGSSLTMVASSFMMGFSVVTSLSSGTKTVMNVLPQIVMCIAMIIGSMIMPRVTNAYNNKLIRKREKYRQEKYSKYLATKEKQINEIVQKQEGILKNVYPDQMTLINIIMNKDRKLWERQINDADFLSVSLGVGKRKSKLVVDSPKEGFELEEDDLKNKVFEIVNKSKYLTNVPITYSLIKRKISAVIFNSKIKRDYINNLILQLITMHSASDLKLVLFSEDVEDYDYVKYVPHVWSEDKKTRFFGSNINDIKNICEELEKECKERKKEINPNGKEDKINDDSYKKFSTYYLIITDSYKKIKDISFISELLKSNGNVGFSILFLENSITDLPPLCKTFTYVMDDNNYIIEPGENYNDTQEFKVENLQKVNMNVLASRLGNIPIPAKAGAAVLPKSLTFLEMYNVSKIEQLNILSRWQDNNPVENLKTPIGVHADRELFMLDLHEKAHGPHGLIAGSTGSGKSEFIITFVLSMAINYHPNEVQFVLIDYKGGGLAGAFENRDKGICLPHLAGTITNLDTAEMNRTLVSINSELKRRQAKFNAERERLDESTMDIYKYQKLYREGKIKEPIAHLLLIADEFAELKSQQPEFMDELISTARIGRSLGVHLILATQKPSGVVNDQIWANAKFKICLKVSDRSDSMEMIKKPDAASIKETGRFILQVGYDEYYDTGQSGYSGATYIPSDRVVRKVDDTISYINNVGHVVKTLVDKTDEKETESKENYGDQLTNIVKYIVDVSKKQKIKINKLWLSSISATIQMDDIVEKYEYVPKAYDINPVIGEYDNPSAQTQGLLTVDLTNIGHLIIYGMAGSGKENLLSTLIYNTCINHSPEEVNFYIFDYGAETLKIYNKYPHVGGVVTADENEQVINTLMLIDKEIDRRKALFTEYGGNYRDYLKESGQKLPLIVLVVNYYEAFAESNARLTEPLNTLLRDAFKYGIVFIYTTSVNNSVNGRISQLFLNKITLQQSDNSVYRSFFNAPKGLAPKRYFGRGLVRLDDTFYEFQTASICEKDNVNKLIRETGAKLNEKYKVKAKSAKALPNEVTLDMLMDKVSDLKNVPIGYSNDDKEVYNFNFNKPITPIISKNINDSIPFITALTKEFSSIKNTEVTVLDCHSIINTVVPEVNVYKSDFNNNLVNMIKGINNEKDKIIRIFIIIGLNKFKEKLDVKYVTYFNSLFNSINKFKESKILIVDSYDEYKNIMVEDWYSEIESNNNYIWLGSGVSEQALLNFDDLSDDDVKADFDQVGFAHQDDKTSVIKYVIDKGGI